MNQSFRNSCAILALLSLISPVLAQQAAKPRASQPKPKSAGPQRKAVAIKPTPERTPNVDPATEKERFDAALEAASAMEKAELLVKFIAEFPKSELKLRAEESLAGARAALADERLTSGDLPGAVKLFKLAIETAPKPYSDRLFSAIIATIPANLYWRGHKAEGVELARLIESNISTDARQILILSTFYLGTENGFDAKRLAEAAIALDDKNAAAYQSLASAHRLNFDVQAAEEFFARAIELDPELTISKRSLADMKRALGKAEEAESIYREILATNEKDNQARTGLTLALFDQGKRVEAEAEMAKALEEVPGNVVLLASAAYWYAANTDGDKAVEYAQRAIVKEPRYIWSHIALGRGLMVQGKPVDAERALIAARKYGNFPTLQYEIASARLAAGFFREAVEELRNSFSVVDGSVKTRLGGRIESSADSFAEAIGMERKASILAPKAADSSEASERLKALMEMSLRLGDDKKDEAAIIGAADRFAGGSDNMAVHRKLYAANLLLQNSVAPEKAMELAGDAIVGLDRALDVANPGAAVMANELYEARNVSFARDDFLLIPDVPRQTLIALMRGKVEEITGLALLKQGKPAEATVRFRRALTVLPKDSAWWRSATWNLGTSLAAEGKDNEALETMISSYTIDKPNLSRYITIESLWIKVIGSREGLEERIGPNPLPDFSATARVEPSPSPTSEKSTPIEKADSDVPLSEPNPSRELILASENKTEISPSPSPTRSEPKASPSPEKVPVEITPSEPSPTPDAIVREAKPSPSPELTREPKVEATPSTSQAQLPAKASPSPAIVSAESTQESSAIPESLDAKVSPNPSREITLERSPTPEPSPEKKAENGELALISESTSPKRLDSTVAKASDTQDIPDPRRTSGSLFEPIIISIPKSRREDKAKLSDEGPRNTEKESTGSQMKRTDDAGGGDARPRIVEGKAIVGELMPCQIDVSQETVSLIKNGGSIALLVAIEEGEDIKLLTARSNSPEDIEVRLEPALVEIPGRSMFVVKSVGQRTGLYQVVFSAPCGRKEIMVRVR